MAGVVDVLRIAWVALIALIVATSVTLLSRIKGDNMDCIMATVDEVCRKRYILVPVHTTMHRLDGCTIHYSITKKCERDLFLLVKARSYKVSLTVTA